MFEEYYGLSGAPFKLSPDPKFFFGSRSHNKAMAYLHYGVKQAEGFIVITGPVGAGKTTVIGHLLDQLNRSNIAAAQLLTAHIEPDELLSHVLSAFRIEAEGEGRAAQLEAFEDFLFDQLNRGKRVLLILDEAQNLPKKTLEELRMLSNINYDGTPLFQVFLIGQPEFRELLEAPQMEQLRQRVIASYHLEDLNTDETREYIHHRLSVVGWRQDPELSEAAIKRIHSETFGRPRRINRLCNRLLLYSAMEKLHEINEDAVNEIVVELENERLGPAIPGENKDVVNGRNGALAAKADENLCDENLRTGHKKPGKKEKAREDAKQKKSTPAPGKAQSTKGSGKQAKPPCAVETKRDSARPQSATLSDVATAIAAAAAAQRADDDRELTKIDAAQGGQLERQSRLAGDLAQSAPATNNGSSSWRESFARSVNETRMELRLAHSSVSQLRSALKDAQTRRESNRKDIASSLLRAETLLNDLRKRDAVK